VERLSSLPPEWQGRESRFLPSPPFRGKGRDEGAGVKVVARIPGPDRTLGGWAEAAG